MSNSIEIPEGATHFNRDNCLYYRLGPTIHFYGDGGWKESSLSLDNFQTIGLQQFFVKLSPSISATDETRYGTPDGLMESDRAAVVAYVPPPAITPAPAFMVKPALSSDGLGVVASADRRVIWGA